MTEINQAGKSLIVKWEDIRLNPYQDKAGFWTWGIGHKQQPGEEVPDSITQEQCEQLFERDLAHATSLIEQFITVALSDNQRGALASLMFNCGSAPLRDGLGKVLNRGDYAGCAQHFLLWDKVRIDGVLQVSNGLAERRKEEMELFLS